MAFRFVLNPMRDPQEIAEMQKKLNIDRFDNFFWLTQDPKDFSEIIEWYHIIPEQLLVIGDNFEKDIVGAQKAGAQSIHCPIYRINEGKNWHLVKDGLIPFLNGI
jgi:ribonucleotide monophosphatase NagD (HAD superfamily)